MSNSYRTAEERRELGKLLRRQTPRSSHAQWSIDLARRDPIQLIEDQNEERLDWLVPVRRARMLKSPFAFYRAGARLMAHDLATTPNTGLMVQACGDAHLSNFGLYASPERELVFDLNDFDETLPGPWEWDLKRLVTSIVIAARHNQLERRVSREAAQSAVESYRLAMRQFAQMRATDVWYALTDESHFLSFADQELIKQRALKTISKAKTKDSSQALDRFAVEIDGKYRIKHEPPLLVPLSELSKKFQQLSKESILESYESYRQGIAPHCRVLLEKYKPVDFALKVVGVGSVGTRCWIMMLEGRDRNDPLFLQMKEATASVLEEYLSPSSYNNHGQRVVEGQRMMQTVNDILLGWTQFSPGGHHYYWRQLRDWKGSVDVEHIDLPALRSCARACGWTLARAHARTGDPVAVAAYMGSSATFDRAIVKFADGYADQNQRDYEMFLEQVRNGRLEATEKS